MGPHSQCVFCSIKEIVAISSGQPIPLTISFPIAETVIHITPHTTVAEATEIVIRELGIQKSAGFGLVAGIMEGAEGPLDPEDILCDVISQWGRTAGNKKLFARPDLLSLPLNKLDTFQPVISFRKVFFDTKITEGDLRDDPKLFEFLFYRMTRRGIVWCQFPSPLLAQRPLCRSRAATSS